jgi:hypothetical protein
MGQSKCAAPQKRVGNFAYLVGCDLDDGAFSVSGLFDGGQDPLDCQSVVERRRWCGSVVDGR